jgi:excisionase family DNA binding protein
MSPKQTSPDDLTCSLQQVSAVSKFLSISRSKVYAMMDAGQLPYVKLGKSRRIRWEHVLQLVEQNTVGGGGNQAENGAIRRN